MEWDKKDKLTHMHRRYVGRSVAESLVERWISQHDILLANFEEAKARILELEARIKELEDSNASE